MRDVQVQLKGLEEIAAHALPSLAKLHEQAKYRAPNGLDLLAKPASGFFFSGRRAGAF